MRRIHFAITALACFFTTQSFLVAHEGTALTDKQQRKVRLASIASDLAVFDSATATKRSLGDWDIPNPKSSIDNFLFQKMNKDGVPINALCSDEVFLRRTHLILTGRLPDPQLTRAFLADSNKEKRSAYIDQIIDSQAFTTYWSFWSQEYFQSTGSLLRGGLDAFNSYLADGIAADKPLTQLAEEMLTAFGNNSEAGSTNFKVRSIEGSRYPLDIYDNIAMRASSKFLGISIECISCHDGAYHLEDINLYLAEKTREEFWGMAAYFAGTRFRVLRDEEGRPTSVQVQSGATTGYLAESDNGDRPIRDGGLIEPAYLFDGDSTIVEGDLLETFAKKITQDRQFARHWANLLWAHVFGLGLVEPIDGFDPYRLDPKRPLPEGWTYQAFDIDLLEHITDAFISGGYRLKNFLRTLLNTSAFQMDSSFAPGKWDERYTPYYTRFIARRLTAESIYDNILVATGVEAPMTVATRNRAPYAIQYAHELPDTSQPRGARQANIALFLNAFGRGNRYDTPRSNEGGISQALALMNSEIIHNKLVARNSRIASYANQALPTTTLIQELYLDVLGRHPLEEEISQLTQELNQFETDLDRASTLMWLLLNRVEFTFVY